MSSAVFSLQYCWGTVESRRFDGTPPGVLENCNTSILVFRCIVGRDIHKIFQARTARNLEKNAGNR